MRLKTLEIKGFKSFADKTVLHFDEGITGVIGPNGCGKSNIVDSIRWVIGEHKMSSLRSENLESLVFNGSRTRSSSGLAEVSLTFENTKNLLPTEFNTVTVTRKFYKSGESEYRLNDVSCRLKDIHNLFMDTGVSTDSYAIIELGMVDDIIKDKDNSRRRMLEQAAGISIYKTRKKEARQKLDATEQDLARIEDLLFEINNQLKTLEGQAKKAEKYFEAKKEYRTLSIELAKASLEGFNLSYKELQDRQEAETDRRFQLEAAIATEEAHVEQEKVAFVEKERTLQALQQQYNQLVQELRTKENEKNLASQRLHYLKEREQSTRDFLDKSMSQLKGLEESIDFSGRQVADEQAQLEDSRDRLDDLKTGVEDKRAHFDDKRAGTDLLRRENQALQRQQFDAEKNVAVADTSILNLQRSAHQLREEQTQCRDQIARLEQEKVAKEAELSAKKAELESLQTQHENAKAHILETQQQVEQLRLQLADDGRRLDARRNEHDLLKSLIDSMEGYPESVKFLHKNKGWNHEAPILSDIIYVKEEFRAALENVLEPYLSYYVVNNLAEGLQAVHLLDEHKKGKANFFLLDQFGGATAQQPGAIAADQPGSAVAAHTSGATHQPPGTLPSLDVVEVDERYRPLVDYLLGNVYIAETEDALHHSNGAVVLEKTGKYVKGRYALTGGSVGLFEGKKIGRAKNLEKLKEQIEAQEKVVSGLKEQIQARHQEVAHYTEQLKEQAIRQTQQEINQLTNQAYALQNKLENLHSQEVAGTRRLEDLEDNLQRTQDSISDQRDLLERLNAQLEELSIRMQGAEEAYASAEQEYNFSQAQYNEANLQLTRQQSKVTGLRQELEFKNNQLRDLQVQVEQNTGQLQDTARQIEDSNNALQDSHEGVVDLMHRKEEAEVLVNTSEQAYYNLRNTLAEKESELRHKQKTKEQVDFLLGQLKDKVTELRFQLTGMKERLSVEFRVDLDAIIDQERETDSSVEELNAAAERLKKRMENMGEVNPTAIEAFTEMKKRYEFIMEQKNDLVTAKDSLLQTIQEVESTANQKFLDTFNAVRENFQRVFKALFTEEDTADIVLENPENLAETSIDIVAKPKGKRPSSISQLSGGEKTLTATALLFAIYLIKPAPFCILDEVDAPLDDANVGKFTQMIRQFSENSQFIIITHNKTTMSTVDVIYGVTMQEPGVSKLVPVDFRSLTNQAAPAAAS